MLFAPIWCLPQLPSQLSSASCSTYPRTWWNGPLFRGTSKKGPLPMSVKTVPRLQLEGISRTFSLADGRQRAVLDDISLTVNPGEFVSIILSDRVVVLSPRPAKVSHILDVDLPKPRGIDALTSPRFLELERTLLQTLGS